MRHVLLALVLMLTGCSNPKIVSPSIWPNDPIKSYQQYEAAVRDALLHLPPSITQAQGVKRYVAVVQEMMKSDSYLSRRCAEAILDSLRKDGINVSVVQPPKNIRSNRMSYAELARFDALVMGFCRQGDGDTSPIPNDQRLSAAAHYHVMMVIAKHSPSDVGAMHAIAVFMAGPLMDAQVDVATDQPKLDAFRVVLETTCERYTDPDRPLNLTSLRFFWDLSGTPYAMMFGAYAAALLKPETPFVVPPQVKTLSHKLVESAKRARTLDPSPEVQDVLDHFIEYIVTSPDFYGKDVAASSK